MYRNRPRLHDGPQAEAVWIFTAEDAEYAEKKNSPLNSAFSAFSAVNLAILRVGLLVQKDCPDRIRNFDPFLRISLMQTFDQFMFDQLLIREIFAPESDSKIDAEI